MAKKIKRVREVKFNWQLFLILFTLAFLAISIVALNKKLNTIDSEAKSLQPQYRNMVQNCIQHCKENFGNWQNQGLCVAACNKLLLTTTPPISPFQNRVGQPTSPVIQFPTVTTTP